MNLPDILQQMAGLQKVAVKDDLRRRVMASVLPYYLQTSANPIENAFETADKVAKKYMEKYPDVSGNDPLISEIAEMLKNEAF